MASQTVYVLGVGQTKYRKPSDPVSYTDMALESGVKALTDAGITYDDVEQGFAGYVYGDSTCGHRAFYQFGMTQIPIVNVNSNCSTGSSALWLARNAILGGQCDVAMAIGFEEMSAGPLKAHWDDRVNPLGRTVDMMAETVGFDFKAPGAAQYFGNAALEYHEKYGSNSSHIEKLAHMTHKHSVNNPYAQLNREYTMEEIRNAPVVYKKAAMTRLMCCPTSNGSAAAILVSERWLDRHPDLACQAVPIMSQALATDSPAAYSRSSIELAGADMTRRAAQTAFKKARITPDDVGVIEAHGCFSHNLLICIDALGLSEPGKAHELIDSGDLTYGGKYVLAPSGDLTARGHPLGSTGIGSLTEIVWQMRGWAGKRQVPDLKYGLVHNLGLGGTAVVTILGKPDYSSNVDEDGRTRAGYNPAVEVRGITRADLDRVRSKQFSEFLIAEARL